MPATFTQQNTAATGASGGLMCVCTLKHNNPCVFTQSNMIVNGAFIQHTSLPSHNKIWLSPDVFTQENAAEPGEFSSAIVVPSAKIPNIPVRKRVPDS